MEPEEMAKNVDACYKVRKLDKKTWKTKTKTQVRKTAKERTQRPMHREIGPRVLSLCN